MTEPYVYEALEKDEIRVLQIKRDGKRLCFTLLPVSLSSFPRYTAVSYTWGFNDRTERLYTSNGNAVLAITATAYEVLEDICDDHDTIWIDMICINQHDLAERAQQVAIMGAVYNKASHTVAYIGQPDTATTTLNKRYLWRHGQAPSLISKTFLSKPIMALWDLQIMSADVTFRWTVLAALAWATRPLVRLYPPDWDLKDWVRACYDVQGDRPYFFRRWIVQEMIRSHNVTFQAGRQKLEIADISTQRWGAGSSAFELRSNFPASSTRAAALESNRVWLTPLRVRKPDLYDKCIKAQNEDYSEARFQSSPAFKLLALLVDTQLFDCTDPRDRLFAILPLVSDDIPVEVQPDYVSTAKEVYLRLSRYLLCNRAAEVLGIIKYGFKKDLPTWCVDWSSPYSMRATDFAGMFPGHYRAGYTSADRRQIVKVDGSDAVLIRGKVAHSITDIEIWKQDRFNKYISFEDRLDPKTSELQFATSCWRERIVQNDQPYTGNPFACVIYAGGQLGLVPKAAMPGDVVCIFLGLQPLYVLRPVPAGFDIIGECFLPAFMDGSQLADVNRAHAEPPVSPWQDFRIV